MGYRFTTNLDTPIAEDGVFAAQTIKALQFALGVTVDGSFGPQTVTALQHGLNVGFRPESPASVPPQPVPVPPPSVGLRLAPISTNQVQFIRGVNYNSLHSVVADAAALAGVPNSWVTDMETIIIPHESSGDPNSVNTSDSNAIGPVVADGNPFQCSRGLAQTIPQTFAANHAAGTSVNIYDPRANVAAAFIYIERRYGDISHVPGVIAVQNGRSYVGY